jgi:hypothetical protein
MASVGPRAVGRSVSGPLLPFANDRFVEASRRRGRRCPLGAHPVAVCASLRLHCDARPGVASQNSLRSLRSLRSNICDESVYEARCACRPQGCASRRHTNRPHRAPPAALHRLSCSGRTPRATPRRRVRAGRSAPVGRREAQRSWPRAQRESSTDSSRMFERSERSERSEFCDGATSASIAGQSERSADRSSEAHRPARTCLCSAEHCPGSGHSRTAAMGRNRPTEPDRYGNGRPMRRSRSTRPLR